LFLLHGSCVVTFFHNHRIIQVDVRYVRLLEGTIAILVITIGLEVFRLVEIVVITVVAEVSTSSSSASTASSTAAATSTIVEATSISSIVLETIKTSTERSCLLFFLLILKLLSFVNLFVNSVFVQFEHNKGLFFFKEGYFLFEHTHVL
jgi:hypothetical protein